LIHWSVVWPTLTNKSVLQRLQN